MTAPLLKVEKLSAYYGQSQVLWDVDLEIGRDQVVAIIGRNGVGKTTLLKSIMGLQSHTDGRLIFDGDEVQDVPPHGRARSGIAIVPQGRHIFPHLTVMQNLETGLSAQGGRGNGKVPDYIFDLFPKLKDIRHRNGGFLSGGEQQQLAIGRALTGAPKLILLDEPTEGIQPNVVQQIEEALRTVSKELKVAVVIVEQYLQFVWRFADKVSAMQNGRIVLDQPIDAVELDDVAKLVKI